MSREQAQELHGLSAKPAANLDADNDEAVFSDNVGSLMETFRGSRALLPGMGPSFLRTYFRLTFITQTFASNGWRTAAPPDTRWDDPCMMSCGVLHGCSLLGEAKAA